MSPQHEGGPITGCCLLDGQDLLDGDNVAVLGKSSSIETPKNLESNSGGIAKVERPHIRIKN